MTATAHKIQEAFKELSPKEQAELFAHLETILYGDEEGDRIAFERDRAIDEGKATTLSEAEVRERFGQPPA